MIEVFEAMVCMTLGCVSHWCEALVYLSDVWHLCLCVTYVYNTGVYIVLVYITPVWEALACVEETCVWHLYHIKFLKHCYIWHSRIAGTIIGTAGCVTSMFCTSVCSIGVVGIHGCSTSLHTVDVLSWYVAVLLRCCTDVHDTGARVCVTWCHFYLAVAVCATIWH